MFHQNDLRASRPISPSAVSDNIDRRKNTSLRCPEATLFPMKEYIFRNRNPEVAASET
jgi:hypothetical protein